jgi:hypothetical protein
MSNPASHSEPQGKMPEFSSIGSGIVVVDGPGVTPIQPLSPEYYRKMQEWRARQGLPPLPRKQPLSDNEPPSDLPKVP